MQLDNHCRGVFFLIHCTSLCVTMFRRNHSIHPVVGLLSSPCSEYLHQSTVLLKHWRISTTRESHPPTFRSNTTLTHTPNYLNQQLRSPTLNQRSLPFISMNTNIYLDVRAHLYSRKFLTHYRVYIRVGQNTVSTMLQQLYILIMPTFLNFFYRIRTFKT